MPADERARVQERMAEWARLTPAQRAQARMQFQAVRQLPPEERNAKWQAYQALSPSEREKLAQQAKPVDRSATVAAAAGKAGSAAESATGRRPVAVTAAASSAAGKPVAPIILLARPGATTTTMSVRTPATARPQGQGAPKIAASSTDVDPATLLPKRAPQLPAPPASGPEASEQP